eukprot:GILK01012010.1.p1 GENE.GILK01012010.1~~GILK01012010.1.p1  ORF type:complete len:1074 (-),score=228.04 GILK01012010.1:188-3313(-)
MSDISDILARLVQGTHLTKRTTGKNVHTRTFSLAADHSYIKWNSNFKSSNKVTVAVKNIKEIVVGQSLVPETALKKTPQLLHSLSGLLKQSDIGSFPFTIFYSTTVGSKTSVVTLELGAHTKEDLESWVTGLTYLIEENKNRLSGSYESIASNSDHPLADAVTNEETLAAAEAKQDGARTPLSPKGIDTLGRGSAGIANMQDVTGPLARCVEEYVGNEQNELTVHEGDIIMVLQQDDSGWWAGRVEQGTDKGKVGWFPTDFVKLLNPPEEKSVPVDPPISESSDQPGIIQPDNQESEMYAICTAAYVSKNEGQLSMEPGDLVRIIQRESDGWWAGYLKGTVGWFPAEVVDLQTRPPPPEAGLRALTLKLTEDGANDIDQQVHEYLSRQRSSVIANNSKPVKSPKSPRKPSMARSLSKLFGGKDKPSPIITDEDSDQLTNMLERMTQSKLSLQDSKQQLESHVEELKSRLSSEHSHNAELLEEIKRVELELANIKKVQAKEGIAIEHSVAANVQTVIEMYEAKFETYRQEISRRYQTINDELVAENEALKRKTTTLAAQIEDLQKRLQTADQQSAELTELFNYRIKNLRMYITAHCEGQFNEAMFSNVEGVSDPSETYLVHAVSDSRVMLELHAVKQNLQTENDDLKSRIRSEVRARHELEDRLHRVEMQKDRFRNLSLMNLPAAAIQEAVTSSMNQVSSERSSPRLTPRDHSSAILRTAEESEVQQEIKTLRRMRSASKIRENFENLSIVPPSPTARISLVHSPLSGRTPAPITSPSFSGSEPRGSIVNRLATEPTLNHLEQKRDDEGDELRDELGDETVPPNSFEQRKSRHSVSNPLSLQPAVFASVSTGSPRSLQRSFSMSNNNPDPDMPQRTSGAYVLQWKNATASPSLSKSAEPASPSRGLVKSLSHVFKDRPDSKTTGDVKIDDKNEITFSSQGSVKSLRAKFLEPKNEDKHISTSSLSKLTSNSIRSAVEHNGSDSACTKQDCRCDGFLRNSFNPEFCSKCRHKISHHIGFADPMDALGVKRDPVEPAVTSVTST